MILSKKKLIVSALLFSFFFASCYFSYKKGQESTQAEWDKYALEQTKEYLKRVQEAANKQTELESKVNELRGTYEQDTSRLRVTVDSLNERLREREKRPAAIDKVPEAAPTKPNSSGCTGKELYAEDGRFLVRESQRADQLRALLLECRYAYDQLR